MISNILLPSDFSDVANNALKFAIGLCKKTGASLHVLHVKSIPIMDANMPPETFQLLLSEIDEMSDEGLKKIENDILKSSGIKYEFHSATGFVTDEVNDFAEKNKIDLITMGTTGSSGLQEILVGSNTASIVAKSHVPVLVIPPSSVFHDMKHLLYSTDYNEPEFPAVSRLMYFADLFKAKLTILHIKTNSDRYFASENNFFIRNKSNITHNDIKVVNLENIEVTDAINKYIDEEGVDMVVMAKHNRSWFDRIFHRSLSKKMTYHTRVPLLVLNK